MQAIDSVLQQTFQDFTLFLVDDGSTDDTRKDCRAHLDSPKVRYIYKDNGGLASARNTGIRASTGEFICFIDDDDIWRPDKLQRQVEFVDYELSELDDWGLVFTWIELIDEKGDTIGYRGHHNTGSLYRDLFFGNIIDAPSSVLVKRGVFDEVGLFDESLKRCQDWDMWLRVAKNYLIFPIKEYLVRYREHTNRLSSDNQEVFSYETALLKKALATAPKDIIPREVYASCHVNRSVAHFAADEYRQFRTMLLTGVRLSVKALRTGHLLLVLLSFFGSRTIGRVRAMKRFLHKMMVGRKGQSVSRRSRY